MRVSLIAACLLGAAACHDRAAALADAGVDGAAGPALPACNFAVASGRNPDCPSAPPTAGASCPTFAACEYGGDALGRNTVFAYCASAGGGGLSWNVVMPYNAVPPNPAACPTTWAAAQDGASCDSDVNLACDYDEGRCACVCNGDGSVSWACRGRSDVYSDLDCLCPAVRPRMGDACAAEGITCYYDRVCGQAPLTLGPALWCSKGYWQAGIDSGAACIKLMCPGWTGWP